MTLIRVILPSCLVAKGHMGQLPSGSFRVSVYAGTDPLTRRAIRLKVRGPILDKLYAELKRCGDLSAPAGRSSSTAMSRSW